MRERSCGLHGTFKAFRVNRVAIIKLIMDQCLPPEERKDMTQQNIIYKCGEPFVFIGMQYPGYYSTQVWSATDLLRRYAESHSK
jgi:hypothetical protein